MQPPKSKPYFITSRYRPGDSMQTIDKVEKAPSYLDKEEKETILLGDTNWDLTKRVPELPADNNSKHICSLYELFSFKQSIEESAMITPNRSSISDHIAATSLSKMFHAGEHKLFMSEHCMDFVFVRLTVH